MDSLQLQSLLQGLLRDVFCGVWPSDRLPSLTSGFRLPAYFIVNTHPAHMPGEHWLALTLEKDGEATFFDSYGFPPDFSHYPSSILNFLEKYSKTIKYHHTQLQHPLSSFCGHHCVYYLCHRACGLSFEQVLELYEDDVMKNDLKAYSFVKKYQRCIKKPARTVKQGNCSFQFFKQYCN